MPSPTTQSAIAPDAEVFERSRTYRLATSTRSQGPLRRLWALVAVERRLLWVTAVLQVLQVLTYIPFTAATQYLIDDIFPYCKANGVWWPLVAYAAANLALWPIHAGFTVWAFYRNQQLVRTTVARLRRLVVDQLQHLSLGFFASRGAGSLSNQLTVDMSRVEGFLGNVSASVVIQLTLAIATTLYLLAVNPLLALIALCAVPPQIIVIKLLARRIQAVNARVQRSGESFASKIVEYIAGMRQTRSFGNEQLATGQMTQSIEEMRTAGLEASVTMRWLSMGQQFGFQYMTTVVWCVGIFVVVGERLTMGELIAFIGLLHFVFQGATGVFGAFESWTAARPGMEALLRIIDSQELEGYLHPKREVALTGAIELEDVTFAYRQDAPPVLRSLSLRIPAGQRIGLVGETGAGKSTFLDLVLGFYVPTEGSIRYDGTELQVIGRRQLRRATAIMGQDSFLWNTTVRENIRFGRPSATAEEIEQAARKAQAHDFIMGLEHGYGTNVGERGSKLSGGQRQRVALARVFLRDPRIVVLDEPTSALDLETEARLQHDLDDLCRGRTTFIVAHRLSTLRAVDRILVFSQGRVVEDGAPAELLARADGHFARLHSLQWKADNPARG